MITIRTIADITADHQVTVILPADVPTGRAELVVTVMPQENGGKVASSARRHFGSVHSGDPRSADNDRIDADLAREYGVE